MSKALTMLLTKDIIEIKPPVLERYTWEYEKDGFVCEEPIGPIRRSEMGVTVAGDEPIAILLDHFNRGAVLSFDIHGFRGAAYVTEVSISPSFDGLPQADASLRLTGPVLAKGECQCPDCRLINCRLINCRCVAVPVLTKEKWVMKKVHNRFYVASDKMTSEMEQASPNTESKQSKDYTGRHNRWAKNTVAQAIDHARELLEKDPAREHVAIVKVIKLVRRKKMPIIVEDVK